MPGQLIFQSPIFAKGTYIENNKTYAATVGFLEENRFVPTKLAYRPTIGEKVVGIVIDVKPYGYKIDLNLPLVGFLPSNETKIRLSLGDIITAEIKDTDEVGNAILAFQKKLSLGKVIDFPPAKVPRLIGKKNSMINLIEEKTKTKIIVGNNGYVWISGNNIPLVIKIIELIKQKAHIHGLTQEVSNFIEKELKR